ncbi:MAG: hypothetical protein J6C19_13555 [Lachnospiraceae bacterium]|nr:hypothetical protein [Lachnospiraceae bacterium]MBO5146536.1 hypothetical protein [Lachnospiraceae bacterium]
MNCEEFLRQFREALDGKVSEQIIQDNENYYRAYIHNQTAGGKSESEVLKLLGEPRLLAKTIEESSKFASGGKDGGQSSYGGYYASDSSSEYEYTEPGNKKKRKLSDWLITIGVIVVILFLMTVVFRVFAFLAPVIIAVIAGGVLCRLIRNWFDR